MLGPYTHRIDPILADVGGLHLWWYGLSYALGFLEFHVFLQRARHRLGLTVPDVYSLGLFFMIGVLVGGEVSRRGRLPPSGRAVRRREEPAADPAAALEQAKRTARRRRGRGALHLLVRVPAQVKDANEELGRMNVRLQEQSDDPLTRLWL